MTYRAPVPGVATTISVVTTNSKLIGHRPPSRILK
jgi:hypothetical protein